MALSAIDKLRWLAENVRAFGPPEKDKLADKILAICEELEQEHRAPRIERTVTELHPRTLLWREQREKCRAGTAWHGGKSTDKAAAAIFAQLSHEEVVALVAREFDSYPSDLRLILRTLPIGVRGQCGHYVKRPGVAGNCLEWVPNGRG